MTAAITPDLTASIALIDDRESAYFSALETAIAELAPKVSDLEREIEQCRDQLHKLNTQPIPHEDFPTFISGYVDALAAKGAIALSKHLDAEIANIADSRHDRTRRVPLAFDQVIALMNGRDVPRLVDTAPLPLPMREDGSLVPEVLMYLLGDEIKAKLETLTKSRPISYRNGCSAGASIADRKPLVESAKARLQVLVEEHERCISRLADLRRKLGRRV